jgi:hypothetical protein
MFVAIESMAKAAMPSRPRNSREDGTPTTSKQTSKAGAEPRVHAAGQSG